MGVGELITQELILWEDTHKHSLLSAYHINELWGVVCYMYAAHLAAHVNGPVFKLSTHDH